MTASISTTRYVASTFYYLRLAPADVAELDPKHTGTITLFGVDYVRDEEPTRGTLWERVAEMGLAGVVNSPRYTSRIADAFNNATRARFHRTLKAGVEQLAQIQALKGMPVAEAPYAYRSGRIEAGILHGNRVSAPYEPTPTHRMYGTCDFPEVEHPGFECQHPWTDEADEDDDYREPYLDSEF